jgi:RNA polymerase sigma-70 factor (ECF subfamily)
MRRGGDQIADVYAAHFRPLSVQLYAYTGDLDVAQELVQEAFARAIPRWHRISTYDDPVAWLRRVAFNLAASRWRRVRVARMYAHRQLPEEVAVGPGPEHVALVAALAKLPDRHRRAVVMHHLGDVPVAEIAGLEGVPEGTVRVWLHRGRAALAAELAEAWEEGGRHV